MALVNQYLLIDYHVFITESVLLFVLVNHYCLCGHCVIVLRSLCWQCHCYV